MVYLPQHFLLALLNKTLSTGQTRRQLSLSIFGRLKPLVIGGLKVCFFNAEWLLSSDRNVSEGSKVAVGPLQETVEVKPV